MRIECDYELMIRYIKAFNIHSTSTKVFSTAYRGLICNISVVYRAMSVVNYSICSAGGNLTVTILSLFRDIGLKTVVASVHNEL